MLVRVSMYIVCDVPGCEDRATEKYDTLHVLFLPIIGRITPDLVSIRTMRARRA